MADRDREKTPSDKKRRSLIHYLLTKYFGLRDDPENGPHSEDNELQRSIEKLSQELSSGENILEKDEQEMIHGIVELGETEVREVMIPRVDIVGIETGSTIADVIEIVKKTGHSRFPLYVDSLDDIKGILYAKDILTSGAINSMVDLAKVSRKAYFIPDTMKLDDLLRDLKRRHLHVAIAVDEYGGTAGLITMEDIVEEIIGDIEDEYDKEPPPIVRQSKDIFLVDGSVTIYDLNDETGLNLPEEEFETVGGLIYDLVGSVPEKGRSVDYHNVTFVVEEMDGQRIEKVRMTISSPASDDIVSSHQ